jgi:hypothetical protein
MNSIQRLTFDRFHHLAETVALVEPHSGYIAREDLGANEN